MQKPKKRGAIRLRFGTAYFRLKRHLFWRLGGTKFAKKHQNVLAHCHFSHSTPLLRNLRNADPIFEQNKIVNLRICLPKINLVTLQPGETFSFWKLVGKPTRRKGYLEGVALHDGKFIGKTGGGLCHLSGFIYWMTLHTPLTITERHRHGYDTTPDKFFGSDATCFYNYKDLTIKNNTAQVFQLRLKIDTDHLVGEWASNRPPKVRYEIYEKEQSIREESWGGHTRHNRLHRKIFDMDNTLIGDEFVAENHAIMMHDPA